MIDEPWLACESPDRPFDAWMWLCDCDICLRALQREAADRPRLTFCLKTYADRVYVTAERLCEAMSSGQAAESLCYVEDDWVREVFVVDRELPVGMDWWSLTLAEETGESAEWRGSARTR